MEVPKLGTLSDQQAHVYATPLKKINEGQDVTRFLVSKAYRDIMAFVLQLNRAMFPTLAQNAEGGSGHAILSWELGSSHVVLSDSVRQLQGLVHTLNAMIDEVPPDPGPRRFGNVSFRRWCEAVEARLPSLFKHHLPAPVLSHLDTTPVGAEAELQSYLLGALGSSQRLDYGTGHELSFLAFLGCIWKLGGFEVSLSGNEERGIVLGIIQP